MSALGSGLTSQLWRGIMTSPQGRPLRREQQQTRSPRCSLPVSFRVALLVRLGSVLLVLFVVVHFSPIIGEGGGGPPRGDAYASDGRANVLGGVDRVAARTRSLVGVGERIKEEQSYRHNYDDEHEKEGGEEETEDSTSSHKFCFPPNFLFGTATSAYQIEGGWNLTGREPSIWDDFCREKGREGVECANVADDSIHRYKDDVKLVSDELGLQSYRFSVSWSRAMNWDPEARRMRRNDEGLAYYRSLLDELKRRGVVPILTIFHWDMPSSLHNALEPKGLLNPDIVDHFVEYAELLYREFGRDVPFWSTFNEPFTIAQEGFGWGNKAPGYGDSPTNAYLAGHHILLSHAAMVDSFRRLRDGGDESANDGAPVMVIRPDAKISMNLNYEFRYPLDPTDDRDIDAAERSHAFGLGWFLDPIVHGDYPHVMRERAGRRLPTFTPDQSESLRGSYDLLMLNHYSSMLATDCDSPTSATPCDELAPGWQRDLGVDDSRFPEGSRLADLDERSGEPECPWFSGYPPGYYDTILYVHRSDPTADILLTENGWCGNSTVRNDNQLWYHEYYLREVARGLGEGLPIVGYTAWSLMDNYEWGSFGPRFGLYHVSYPDDRNKTGSKGGYVPKDADLQRVQRPAATFYSRVAKSGCLTTVTSTSTSTAASSPIPPPREPPAGRHRRRKACWWFGVVIVVVGVIGVVKFRILGRSTMLYERIPHSSG